MFAELRKYVVVFVCFYIFDTRIKSLWLTHLTEKEMYYIIKNITKTDNGLKWLKNKNYTGIKILCSQENILKN